MIVYQDRQSIDSTQSNPILFSQSFQYKKRPLRSLPGYKTCKDRRGPTDVRDRELVEGVSFDRHGTTQKECEIVTLRLTRRK